MIFYVLTFQLYYYRPTEKGSQKPNKGKENKTVFARELPMLESEDRFRLGAALTEAAAALRDTDPDHGYAQIVKMKDNPEILTAFRAITGLSFVKEEARYLAGEDDFLGGWDLREMDWHNNIPVMKAVFYATKFIEHIRACTSQDQIDALYLTLQMLTGYSSFAELLYWHTVR